jgi:hypothetical protein
LRNGKLAGNLAGSGDFIRLIFNSFLLVVGLHAANQRDCAVLSADVYVMGLDRKIFIGNDSLPDFFASARDPLCSSSELRARPGSGR